MIVERAQPWQRALESLKRGFERLSIEADRLACGMFHTPYVSEDELLLKLHEPPSIPTSMLGISEWPDVQFVSHCRTPYGLPTGRQSRQTFLRQFEYFGSQEARRSFTKIAETAGNCLLSIPMNRRPSAVSELTIDTHFPSQRWLFCVFDLAWRGDLPSFRGTRYLWRDAEGEDKIRSLYGHVPEIVNHVAEGIAKDTLRDRDEIAVQLENYHCSAIPDLFAASVEAVDALLNATVEPAASRGAHPSGEDGPAALGDASTKIDATSEVRFVITRVDKEFLLNGKRVEGLTGKARRIFESAWKTGSADWSHKARPKQGYPDINALKVIVSRIRKLFKDAGLPEHMATVMIRNDGFKVTIKPNSGLL